MTSAITLFLKSAVNYEGIPFEIKRILNKETMDALNEYQEMKSNKEKYKRYDSLDEIINEMK